MTWHSEMAERVLPVSRNPPMVSPYSPLPAESATLPAVEPMLESAREHPPESEAGGECEKKPHMPHDKMAAQAEKPVDSRRTLMLDEERSTRTRVIGRPKGRKTRRTLPEIAAKLGLDKRASAERAIASQTLVAVGLSVGDAAHALNVPVSAVKTDLARKTAKDVLRASEEALAENWLESARIAASRGRHEPAQAALVAIGAVESEQKGGGTSLVVNVGVALPGTPGGDK
jgi:hypothetical protein